MIGVEVHSNIHQVVAEWRLLTDGLVNKAIVRALNRAQDQAATAANREIRKVYKIKAGAVSAAFKKRRASTKGAVMSAVLEVRGKRIGLIEFTPRKTAKGITVQIKVDAGRKLLPGSFIATNSHTGYRGVFRRVGKSRYPIVNLRSITVPQAFYNRTVLKAINQVANESFEKTYRQQVKYLRGK